MLTEIRMNCWQGESFQLKGNESLLLDAPETIWIVKSGSMALFAVAPHLKRRYLCRLVASEAMFVPLDIQATGLLAVSLEVTELLRVSRKEFERASDFGAIALIEGWVKRLSLVLSNFTPSILPTQLEGVNHFSLMPNNTFQPRSEDVVWVLLQQGYAQWMGLKEFPLTPASGMIPLSSAMWFQTTAQVEFQCFCPTDVDVATLIASLSQFHTYIFQYIAQLEQQEYQQELLRFQEQEQLERQVITETLGELVSVLPSSQTPTSQTLPQVNDPLLVAVGAVGHALGIRICPPDRLELKRGENPLAAIARTSHVRLRQVSLTTNWWTQDVGPLLAYRQEDRRPVAILPVSSTRCVIYDPIAQTSTPTDSNSAAQLSSTAYMFYRSLPLDLSGLSLFKFALHGHFKELAIVALMGVLVTLLGMLTPQATAILIDRAIPSADRGLVGQMGLGLLASAFGSTLFQLAQSVGVLRLETFADASTQAAVWDRLLNLKPAFFRQYSIGDLNSRVSAISQIHQKLSSTVLKSTLSSVFSLLNLGLLFYYNSQLALLALGVAIVNIILTLGSGMVTLHRFRALLNLQGKLFGVVVQLVNGVVKLRVAGAESRAFAFWGKQYSHQLKITLMTQSIEDLLAVINKVLPSLTSAALFWFTVQVLSQSQQNGAGSFSIGTFLAFNSAFGTFISGATSLSNTAIDSLQILPLWKRAEPILKATPEVDKTKTDPGQLSGSLRVEHVVFRYREGGPQILDDVTIEAKPGEFIAIVGPSGSGKSTLFRLLLGFDTPESGTIYYDGQDLAGLDVHAVRRQLGVVLQNSRLISASILDNIATGAPISLEEAWEAARMAGLAEDIEAMPMGIHTVVSEGGTNLSGGQRQRLFIARAMALKPKLLLFDEATSALDNRTQAIVSASLERLQVTRIVIAHRLSTIRHADRIYVFDNGRIVQQGNFDRLADEPGLFTQLMQRQII